MLGRRTNAFNTARGQGGTLPCSKGSQTTGNGARTRQWRVLVLIGHAVVDEHHRHRRQHDGREEVPAAEDELHDAGAAKAASPAQRRQPTDGEDVARHGAAG